MNGDAFVELQRLDSALEQIGHRRARLAELTARDAAAAALAEQRGRLAAAQQRATAAEATIDQAERDAAALTVKRTRLEAQLKTIIAPREAEALMHEIATLNAGRGELDDVELQALDLQADAEAAAARITEQLPVAVESLAVAQSALDAASAELDEERDGYVAARHAAAEQLPAADIAVYEQARTHFHGVAIAKLEGSRCGACHLDISRGEIDAIRALPPGELGECPQCGRFLVR